MRYRVIRALLEQLLCRIGLHDDRVVSASFGFSPGTGTETVECRRCGRRAVRNPRS